MNSYEKDRPARRARCGDEGRRTRSLLVRTKAVASLITAGLALAVATSGLHTPVLAQAETSVPEVSIDAQAIPGSFWVVNLYDRSGRLLTQVIDVCPSERRSTVNVPTRFDNRAHYYRAGAYCRLSAFDLPNGRGFGVGLNRDRRLHHFGDLAGRVSSIAAYGPA